MVPRWVAGLGVRLKAALPLCPSQASNHPGTRLKRWPSTLMKSCSLFLLLLTQKIPLFRNRHSRRRASKSVVTLTAQRVCTYFDFALGQLTTSLLLGTFAS